MVLSFGPLGRELLVGLNLLLIAAVGVIAATSVAHSKNEERARVAAGQEKPLEKPPEPLWERIAFWVVAVVVVGAAGLIALFVSAVLAELEWAALERWVFREEFARPPAPDPPPGASGSGAADPP